VTNTDTGSLRIHCALPDRYDAAAMNSTSSIFHSSCWKQARDSHNKLDKGELPVGELTHLVILLALEERVPSLL
jgi:hypothetical protein